MQDYPWALSIMSDSKLIVNILLKFLISFSAAEHPCAKVLIFHKPYQWLYLSIAYLSVSLFVCLSIYLFIIVQPSGFSLVYKLWNKYNTIPCSQQYGTHSLLGNIDFCCCQNFENSCVFDTTYSMLFYKAFR